MTGRASLFFPWPLPCYVMARIAACPRVFLTEITNVLPGKSICTGRDSVSFSRFASSSPRPYQLPGCHLSPTSMCPSYTHSECAGWPFHLIDTHLGRVKLRNINTAENSLSLCRSFSPHRTLRNKSGGFVTQALSSDAGSIPKLPSRLAQKQEMLDARTEEFTVEDEGPVPRIGEEHVRVSFARSGGPGGQNVNKVNTKVDMRFNVIDAEWLSERIRLKLLDTEKNRINGDGELVVSSTRTRTQKGNLEDALQKIQAMIDAAAYTPPPPSVEKIKRIEKLAKKENLKRLDNKKKMSNKKADRRSKGSYE